ncbi:TonB-dependent receptor [Methylocystis sp.]|uniref:TonB-dependent receptor n=1 Tax=Methylocystis sp. TaxID=1911079 RepID=UPI0025DC9350|nr:TonB-dependent receptor [Methylocystis sp.]
MIRRSCLLGGASFAALSLFASAADAQQALPTINVGGARAAPRPGPVGRPTGGAGRVTTATPTPGTGSGTGTGAADRYAEPKPAPFSRTLPANIPAVVESRTRAQILRSTNIMTSADAFRYMPSIWVRERYIGDRNAIVSTRTSGTIQSALTLVYADTILLSNLLGNSFNFPPRWGMVSPEEISRIDVMYGPFSALYPGNSIGAVLTMTTRMPDNFEIHASGTAAVQPFSLYSRKELNLGGVTNVLIGDRINDFRYWVGYEHLDNQGQTQTFPGNILVPQPLQGNPPAPRNDPRFFGGHVDFNQEGVPRVITGAAGADYVQTDMAKVKVSYDVAPLVRAKYQIGFWSLNNDTSVESFIRDKNGMPIYNTQSGRIQLGPFFVTPGGVNPSHGAASHVMQGLELRQDTGGVFDYDLSASSYNFVRDFSNGAQSYGPRVNAAGTAYNFDPRGLNANNGGTYWRTGDARAIWRVPYDLLGKHEVSFGAHGDVYSLNTLQTSTVSWPNNYYLGIQAFNTGKTETKGVYVQEVWKPLPDWKFTAGGRGEWWRAFNGMNSTGGLNVTSQFSPGLVSLGPAPAAVTYFPDSYKGAFSPKAALEYQFTPEFKLRGSIARAYRFPTVSELFQALRGPSSQLINNPNLQPENCTCYDLTGEYRTVDAFRGAIGLFNPRISLFMDDRWNAIVSQSAINGAGIIVTQNANMDKVRFRGVEAVTDMKDILIPGLDFNGGVTFTDAKIQTNLSSGDFTGARYLLANGNVNPLSATVPSALYGGRQFPRVPRIRFRGVVTYTPNPDMSFALGARYSSPAFVTFANTDFNHNNYGSVDSEILVFDMKARYRLEPHWWLSVGVNNIGRWKAYVNPNPYPQRTFFIALNYHFGGPEDVVTVDRGGSGGTSAVR